MAIHWPGQYGCNMETCRLNIVPTTVIRNVPCRKLYLELIDDCNTCRVHVRANGADDIVHVPMQFRHIEKLENTIAQTAACAR